ncbi:MAG TPA: hypothetical protein VFL83_19310 [Anaeromyxobacter sp.]|nr:hypothetical protein [Anaeromyxobacter sp.]
MRSSPSLRSVAVAAAVAVLPAAALGDGIDVESRVGAGEWGRTAAVEARLGTPVALRVRPVAGGTIRWYRIVPDASRPYNNAVWPWDPGPYRWLGYAKIGYAREELEALRGRWEIAPEAKAGSRWFQAEVIEPTGRVRSSPGLERNDARGLSPDVVRVTFREGDDLVGQLTGFFDVPGVFGSVPYQVRNYLGVDCADVLMAAWARANDRPIERDWNVAALVRELPVVAGTTIASGAPAARLRWGEDVRRGDLLAVRYAGWRQFGHVGALYGDDGDGVLDGEDLVLHAGPQALHLSRLADGPFDGEVKVLRPGPARPR